MGIPSSGASDSVPYAAVVAAAARVANNDKGEAVLKTYSEHHQKQNPT